MITRRNYRRRQESRRGVAAAELAVCLPLFVLLILGSIEACSMIFLNHSLTITSYEGVRVAINYDGTNELVLDRCDEIIDERGINEADIDISPDDVAATPRGTPVTITISAPCEANAILPPWFYEGKTISVSTTMVKE